jgi:hypothetical protein
MNKLLVFIALFFTFINTKAHNPNTSSVTLNPINDIWLVHFSISQEGANYALEKYYQDKNLQKVKLETYKKWYIEYIKKHFLLVVNDKNIPLHSGGIKLGSHQTDMKFLLPDFPKNYEKVELTLNIFETNKGQNTVVKFIDQKKTFRKVLNHKNRFYMSFSNTEEGFFSEKGNKSNYLAFVLLGIGFLILIGAWFFWKKYKHAN